MSPTHQNDAPAAGAVISAGLTLLLSAACGIVVANIYYVQPLVGLISRSYGLPLSSAGTLVTVTQLGYAAGLVLVVPLGDVVENRRTILAMLVALVAALALAFTARTIATFLAASAVIGVMSSSVQIMVPLAGHLAPDASRGRTVGNVVSGLLFGIMLSRPAASFVAEVAGTRSIFILSAGAVAILAFLLRIRLPRRRPQGMPYLRALASLGPLLVHTKVLHRRATYQGALFGAFSLFWTAVPLLLEGPRFGFSQLGIGLFALVGAGGALISPWAGRAADAGLSHRNTGLALLGCALAFALVAAGGVFASWPVLVLGALVLDVAVATHLVTGQRDIFNLGHEARGRLNGLYLALFFLGGAFGSFVAGLSYAKGGWIGTCACGLVFPTLATLVYLSEQRSSPEVPRRRAAGEVRPR